MGRWFRNLAVVAAVTAVALVLAASAATVPKFADSRASAIPVDVELVIAVDVSYSMILVGGRFRRPIAFALLRHDVHEDWPRFGVAYVAQDRKQVVEIVSVDRADIVETELLEQRSAGPEPARVLDPARYEFVEPLRQVRGELLADVAQFQICAPRQEPRKIGRHRADRRRDRHVVVVENDDQPLVARAGIVHRLVGHAGRHRAVADHGNDIVSLALEIAGDRHAKCGRNRRRRMRGAEGVIFAFGTLGEPGQAAALPQRADTVSPAGENLVRVGLVADVPDQSVRRRVKDIVERDRQLDHAKPCTEMAAGPGDGVDHLVAQLVGELPELLG